MSPRTGWSGLIVVKSKDEIVKMEAAGRIVAKTLQLMRKLAAPGISTGELDRRAEEVIRDLKGVPAFKGYRDYPASICASINDEVVHGIPSPKRKLRDGDIISIDLGVILDGFYGDAAVTLAVGQISPEMQKLLDVTEQSLMKGIAKAKDGGRVSDIGHAVQRHVESEGFSVVRSFVGHGIGKELHEEPQVANFGSPGKGPRLREGMTLAIEPMVNVGGWQVNVKGDGWTAVTADGSLSAHFEHTIVVEKKSGRALTITS